MVREPNNEASEKIAEQSRKWFFAVEHTAATSPIDIDDFCRLLSAVCNRYNMKWCQCVWRNKNMKQIPKKKV